MEEDIKKIVDGEYEESYASKFADYVFFNEEEDFGTRLEPKSHKENLETIDDDDEEGKKYDKKDDDNEDDDNDDHTDHKLELTATISLTPDTTFQDHSKPTSSKTKILPGSIAHMSRRRGKLGKHLKTTFVTNKYFQEKMQEIPDLLKNLIPEFTVAKTNKLIKEAVPRLNTVINMYPTTSSSTATTTTADLQHQLYLRMKLNLQDQETNLEMWEILKAKFEKSSRLLLKKHGYRFNTGKIHGIRECTRSTTRESEIIQKSISPIRELLKLSETEQQHGLDFMKQIIMMRENDKPDCFIEADFKYLNKNDIEDIYYLFLNKKFNHRENKLLNFLMTFIRSWVIWERVHDFQMGIESYQTRTNLTSPTLIFHGIEAYDPYSIFCDAMLERVLNEVKLKIFETEFWKKAPLLGELDLGIMKAFKIEIIKRLRHREQMRRWESFVNGRPILPAMKRQGKGHVAKECTQPRRAHNSELFKEKMMLAQAQETRVDLEKEQLAYLADTRERVDSALAAQALTNTAII
ncbi:hypothetical protein Tco_0104843 [Tanacetum coccineum]